MSSKLDFYLACRWSRGNVDLKLKPKLRTNAAAAGRVWDIRCSELVPSQRARIWGVINQNPSLEGVR